METIIPITVSVVAAYFLGAIPTGYLFGRGLKGIDIREHGSKNMGATNVFRTLGKGPGAAVLLIDILKGIIPVTVIANILGLSDPLVLVLIGAAAVAGHNWTVFLKFKGGKGVATSLGVLIGLAIQIPGLRPVLLITIGIWTAVFLLFGYVSLASIMAAVALPILMVIFNAPFVIKIMAIVLCVLVVLRHRSNISRLLKGQENRVNFKK